MHYLAMQLGQVCDIKLCNAFALFQRQKYIQRKLAKNAKAF